MEFILPAHRVIYIFSKNFYFVGHTLGSARQPLFSVAHVLHSFP